MTDATPSDDRVAGAEPADSGTTVSPSAPGLTELRLRTWRGVFVRAGQGYLRDNCVDLAAALTYYGVLAIFPSAIVTVALISLVADGPDAVDAIIGIADELLGDAIVNQVEDPIRDVINQRSPAGVLLSFGLVGAMWSASGYVRSFTRASNAIYGVAEGRPFYRLYPLHLLITAAALLLLALIALALLVSGPVARAIGDALRIGDAPLTAWEYGKWPVLVIIAGLVLSLLFWGAPNVRQPRFRWLTVGGAVALVGILLGSVGFGIYISNFGSYDATYGSLGAAIAFLVWLYVANSAIMLGVEINAELQRGRQMQAGRVYPHGPLLPPRVAAEPDRAGHAAAGTAQAGAGPAQSRSGPGPAGPGQDAPAEPAPQDRQEPTRPADRR